MKVLLDYDGQGGIWIEAGIGDPVVYQMIEEISLVDSEDAMEERLALVANMLEIGARVMQRNQDGQAGELIRRELERVREHLTEAVEVMLSGAGTGFSNAMRPVLEQISTEMASIGGRLDGVLAVSKAQVELEDERERGTAKGRPFEAEVAAAVQSIANYNGDSCEHVGDVATSLAGRAGDVVVEIGGATGPSRGRLVFEAKTGRLSKPEALRELDRAKEARDADFAVLVVQRPEKMPPNTREFHEYGGDKMVVVFDSDPSMPAVGLEVGYALARARVLMSRGARTDGVDTDLAMAAIEDAIQHLERIRSTRGRLTSLAKAAEEIGLDLEGIAGTVRSCLERSAKALHGSE